MPGLARFLLKGGDSGPAIVAGKHAESLLYERVAARRNAAGREEAFAARDRAARPLDRRGRENRRRSEPETLPAGDTFTDEERAHWSFQPIRRPPLPAVQRARTGRLADRRVSARALGSEGSELRPRGRSRDAHSPAVVRPDRLAADARGGRAVRRRSGAGRLRAAGRRLLASPAYGERWGRHWLDVAGYADSDGYSEKDAERKWAYKYRDYVIRAFNDDKPWNEFLVEQLAGDELLTPPYANLTRRAGRSADRHRHVAHGPGRHGRRRTSIRTSPATT